MVRGYRELADAGILGAIPRLVAAETSTGAAFTLAMSLPDKESQERATVDRQPSPAFSIGSDNACWQGLEALWSTDGTAIAIPPESYVDECRRLAAAEGLFLEISSAVAVDAARRLAKQTGATVVAMSPCLGTVACIRAHRRGAP